MKVILADDEQPACARLRRLLSPFADIEIVDVVHDGAAAIRACLQHQPDALFLDINMPVLNGIEVAASIGSETSIVFVTAYDEYAVKAFEHNAIDYLVKPIKAERLAKAIDRLRASEGNVGITQYIKEEPRLEKIGLKEGSKIHVLDLQGISYFTATDEYTEVVWREQRNYVDEPLTRIAERLSPKLFFRCHRGYVVNLQKIKSIDKVGDRKFVARLDDYFQSEVPISRDKMATLRGML